MQIVDLARDDGLWRLQVVCNSQALALWKGNGNLSQLAYPRQPDSRANSSRPGRCNKRVRACCDASAEAGPGHQRGNALRVGRHRKLDLSQQRRAHALRQRSDVLVGGGHRGIDAIGNPAGNANHPEPDERPLDLVVHSQPQLLALADAPVQRMGRCKMLLILLVCAAPVVVSYLTYHLVRPDMRRHFGELIEPQRPLPDQLVTRLDGTVINLRSLKGQWLLTSVAAGQCDDGCQRNLYLQRQLRESLGKDKDRVDWVWIISNATEPSAAIRAAPGSSDRASCAAVAPVTVAAAGGRVGNS